MKNVHDQTVFLGMIFRGLEGARSVESGMSLRSPMLEDIATAADLSRGLIVDERAGPTGLRSYSFQ